MVPSTPPAEDGLQSASCPQRVVISSVLVKSPFPYNKPIVTEIAAADTFYPAEDYHQEYYQSNKNSNPYCAIVIKPKLEKFWQLLVLV